MNARNDWSSWSGDHEDRESSNVKKLKLASYFNRQFIDHVTTGKNEIDLTDPVLRATLGRTTVTAAQHPGAVLCSLVTVSTDTEIAHGGMSTQTADELLTLDSLSLSLPCHPEGLAQQGRATQVKPAESRQAPRKRPRTLTIMPSYAQPAREDNRAEVPSTVNI